MRPGRTSILLLATYAVGCATAGSQDESGASPDAASHDDAAVTTADAPTAASCATPFSGVLASWDFTGETGNQASTAAAATAGGVTAIPIQRSPSLTPVSGGSSINASNWPTAAQLDASKYYTFTIAPPAGCKLALTSLAIDAKASATGPTTAALTTSSDGFVASSSLATASASTVTLAIANATSAIELRVHGSAASGSAGTLRIQGTLSLTGSVE